MPAYDRLAELALKAWEITLQQAGASRNGHRLPDDLVWALSHWALWAPVTASRCPEVRAALPPEVRQAVLAQAAALRVTTVADQASQASGSKPVVGRARLTVGEAAQAIGITAHGVRAACRRDRLAASKDPVTGRWLIEAAAVQGYRREETR